MADSSSAVHENHLMRWEPFPLPSGKSWSFSEYKTDSENVQVVAIQSLHAFIYTLGTTHINLVPVAFQVPDWYLQLQLEGNAWVCGRTTGATDFQGPDKSLHPERKLLGCHHWQLLPCLSLWTLLKYFWLFLNHLLSHFHCAHSRVSC